MKTCKECEKELPLTEFYKQPLAVDGLVNKCKFCYGQRQKEWARNNKEKIRKYRKAYYENFCKPKQNG